MMATTFDLEVNGITITCPSCRRRISATFGKESNAYTVSCECGRKTSFTFRELINLINKKTGSNIKGASEANKSALEDYFDRTITSPFLRAAMKEGPR